MEQDVDTFSDALAGAAALAASTWCSGWRGGWRAGWGSGWGGGLVQRDWCLQACHGCRGDLVQRPGAPAAAAGAAAWGGGLGRRPGAAAWGGGLGRRPGAAAWGSGLGQRRAHSDCCGGRGDGHVAAAEAEAAKAAEEAIAAAGCARSRVWVSLCSHKAPSQGRRSSADTNGRTRTQQGQDMLRHVTFMSCYCYVTVC